MNVLIGVIHTRTLLENLLSDIVTHSNHLLMSPNTPARVPASPNSIVTAIVDGVTNQQSLQIDKWNICIGIIIL